MNVLFTQEKQIMIHTQIALVEIHTADRYLLVDREGERGRDNVIVLKNMRE